MAKIKKVRKWKRSTTSRRKKRKSHPFILIKDIPEAYRLKDEVPKSKFKAEDFTTLDGRELNDDWTPKK